METSFAALTRDLVGRYAYYQRGKEYRESAGSERDAERLLLKRLKEIHGDRFVGPQQERVTVAELLDRYTAHRRLKGVKSAPQAASYLRRVMEFFGEMRACDLTTAQLEAWMDALSP